MSGAKNGYAYSAAQCDVTDETLLEKFRTKRREWFTELKDDEHHAISNTIYEMVWADMSFRTIWQIGAGDTESSLNNHLLAEALIQGYFARQILAIRRLMDNTKNTISLARLLTDIQNNIGLITRENYVSFDGLPYDYEGAQERVRIANQGKSAFWAPQSGPDGYNKSERAHCMFDRLAGIDPSQRARDDRLPKSTIDKLIGWLSESHAKKLTDWSHSYLAHAAGQASRQRFDLDGEKPNLDKVTATIRTFARITEALLAYVLFESGFGSIAATPQFNQFEHMSAPILAASRANEIGQHWDKLADERDRYLEGTLETLVGKTESE